MADLTIIGGGGAARTCGEVLANAGFNLRRTFEFDEDDRSPIVLGEIPSIHTVARQAVAAGRHLLITSPSYFADDRLLALFAERRKAQALFLWSDRRHHPGYRFAAGLVETDSAWQPRYVRQETLLLAAASTVEMRWTAIESIALVMSIVGGQPTSVSANGISNPLRNISEHLSLTLSFRNLQAFLQIGSGEAFDRSETLIAGQARKAFVDELNPNVPVRLITDEMRADPTPSSRWISCPVPTPEELTRQQCLAFLDATLQADLAQQEASVWVHALSAMQAADESVRLGGIQTRIDPLVEEGARLRLMQNGGGEGRLRSFPSPIA